jgi:hypothetical protein
MRIYGEKISAKDIVIAHETHVPPAAEGLIATLFIAVVLIQDRSQIASVYLVKSGVTTHGIPSPVDRTDLLYQVDC